MKKLFFILILIGGFAGYSCKDCPDKAQASGRDTVQALTSEQKRALSLEYHDLNDITMNHLGLLVSNYIDSFPNEAKFFLGAYIDREDLDTILKENIGEGLMTYLCYDSLSDLENPKRFIAFKHVKTYDPLARTNQLNENVDVRLAEGSFAFTKNTHPKWHEMRAELETNMTRVRTHQWLSEAYVESCCLQFANHYRMTGSWHKYNSNENCFGFIPTASLRKILPDTDTQIKGLRIYLGYDGTEPSNRIRFAFVPVDEAGNNMIVEPGKVPTTYRTFFERAWP